MNDINQVKLALVKANKTNKWLVEQLDVNSTVVSIWRINTTQSSLYKLKNFSELLNASVAEVVVSV